MSTLLNSISDPSQFLDPLHRVDAVKEGTEEETKVIEERLAKWKAFSQTRNGRITIELAGPTIDYLTGEICKSVMDFPNLSIGQFEARRNTLIGELRVWSDIKSNSDLLERRLNELAEKEKEDEVKEIQDAESEISPEVQKYAEK